MDTLRTAITLITSMALAGLLVLSAIVYYEQAWW